MPGGGEQGVCSGAFVAEGKDEVDDGRNRVGNEVGDGVTCVSVPYGLALDPVLLVIECEVDEGILCGFHTSCGEGREAAGVNEEGDVVESEWGGLGVRPALAVLSGADKEE